MEQQVREREGERRRERKMRVTEAGWERSIKRQDRNRIKHNREKKQNICRENIKWNREQKRKWREEAGKTHGEKFPDNALSLEESTRSLQISDTEKVRNDL